jgi:anti-sigma factor ChrR (cupin superfamily)
MEINADFSKVATVRPGDVDWIPSPLPGVERIMLDRIGDEVARATSIVRYAPGSRFDAHEHAMGEEYLVLDGVFSDQDGDHGPGSYVRNPPGTSHAPWSDDGCTIFVKLRQFQEGDGAEVSIDTKTGSFRRFLRDGLESLELHKHGLEVVRLLRLAAGAVVPRHGHVAGEEILVLDGTLEDDFGVYPAGTWNRHPPGSRHRAWSKEGCTIWAKTGHLAAR